MSATAEQVSMESAGYQCPPLLKSWQDKIDADKSRHEERLKEFDLNRRYSAGKQHDDGKAGLVRTNLIYTNQATIIPHVYAKNPEIAVSPSKAVHPTRYKVVKEFAATMETVLQRMFVMETRLKNRMRAALYSVYNTGDGWLKMFYQRDYGSDPLIKARIHDSQDNLARLERLIHETKEGTDGRDIEKQRDELKLMIEALNKNVEVVVSEGLVIDRVLSDDMRILDSTITDFDYYMLAEALCHDIWMTKEEYSEKFKGWPNEGAPTIFHERKMKQDGPQPIGQSSKVQLVCVHELWHLRSNSILTFGEGAKTWAREPYQLERGPERWYSFYRLGWNHLDASEYSLPDVSLQRELNDEYNKSRTQWAAAREENRPVRLARANGSLTETDITNINNRKSREIVVVSGNPGHPLQDDIAEFPGVDVRPEVYDTSPIRADMEMVAGRGDAAAGGVVEAKTATEAEIQQAGLMSRSDYRRDVAEDVIAEMAQAAAEILLQELTKYQVEFIAGEGAEWPELSKGDAFALINIDIRAGSTGKPNQAKEREQWMTLLPLIRETIQQISELQAAGQMQMADAMRKLLKETLRRFDERIDLEEFLGPEGEEGDAQAQQMAAMQQQVVQLSQALEQAQAQLQAVDQKGLEKQERDDAYRNRELQLKEQDYARQSQERQQAQAERAMREQAGGQEQVDRVTIEREKWDREDMRAEKQREHDRQMKGIEQQLANVQQQLAEATAARGAEQTDGEDAKLAAIEQTLAEVQQTIAAEQSMRAQRTAAIAAYLNGPRTDESLKATVAKLAGGDNA